MTERKNDEQDDLDALTTWTSRILLFGGLAVAIALIGLVVVAVWLFGWTPWS